MKDISKLKDYREKYKRHYGIDFGKEFAIHHIDENRNNNDINNLILLPNELHSKYHAQKEQLNIAFEDGICTKLTYSGIKVFELQLWYLDKYVEVIKEVTKWVEFKFLVDNGAKTYVEIEGVHKYGFQG